MTTTELTTLLTGLWAKVKSHVTTAINGLATKSELTNYCPIIEDTRTSAEATIIGVAPFATLTDKQRITIRLAKDTGNYTKVNLTLSGGTETGEIPVYTKTYNTGIGQVLSQSFLAGTCMELLYTASTNRWMCLNLDRDTTTWKMSQNEINNATDTDARSVPTAKLLRDNFYLKSEALAKRILVTTGSALTTDTYVDLGATDTIAPTLPASPSRADEFVFTFTCVSALPNITLPPNVELADGFDWSEANAGVQFQVSIQDNIAAYLTVTPNT